MRKRPLLASVRIGRLSLPSLIAEIDQAPLKTAAIAGGAVPKGQCDCQDGPWQPDRRVRECHCRSPPRPAVERANSRLAAGWSKYTAIEGLGLLP